MKTITVKDKTWQYLTILKVKERANNLDEIIRKLIENAGK